MEERIQEEIPLNKDEKIVIISDKDMKQDNVSFYYQKADTKVYVLPAYMAIVIKILKGMDFKQATVQIAFTLVLRVLITGLPVEIVEALKKKIEIRLNEDSISMTEENSQIRSDKKFLSLTARLAQEVTFEPDLHSWPFDLQTISMKVELTSPSLQDGKVVIRFNLHQHKETNTMISFKKQADKMPEYNLAATLTEARLGQEKKGDLVYFPFITYNIKLYREPEHILVAVAIPLILLQLITLGVFLFTQDEYSNRWNTIVTILLALFAFLPTIYGEIPSTASFVLLEKLIYTAIASIFLVALESVIIHFTQLTTVTYVLFGVSAFIWGTTVSYLIFTYSRYLVIKKTKYDLPTEEVKLESSKFNMMEWHNDMIELKSGALIVFNLESDRG